ncbi:MAG TPA: hypothetical protein HA359_01330 [Candidatus Poseidoniaceae archaeon]|nr:MAG TPA: hypothetical protein D7H84_01330 [Candidatus Poseidoniales archaeon]DAC58113.1 MAG TPA: hypothetical protein D7I03_06285 [Candidatus Poseidoniales archaeon]HII22879.1 hypothetical protein [Candidatus Poseidoniaceae archaeon]HII50933.1 hypothetical protein [Candidatus Poseidoniaceae archaeon]
MKGGFDISAPPIIDGFGLVAIIPFFFAAITAYLFWNSVVPRQLRGLQVAFQTGEKRYEVHNVTRSVEDARNLLQTKGMRFGVTSYLFALTGVLILVFEFLMTKYNFSEGFHAPSIIIALLFISIPAIISSGSSLGAQVIKPVGAGKATLQNSNVWQNYSYVVLTLSWMIFVGIVAVILTSMNIPSFRVFSICAFVAFSPAVLAYGRVLGSSWQALKQSSMKIASGEASPFHNHKPSPKQQAIAQIVNLNLSVMPFIAFNTIVSILALSINPEMFTHSDRVLDLPEYRVQSSIMEEGGILGFALIELFAFIPAEGIRVPLVNMVLLFLLLNVALIGFLFVYEVARILFLDVQDVSGKGGIKLADSRLLRAERSQQAKVLNFCFTGFAGQSMLLLALAMITFWDSSFLPQGAACGSWENNLCTVIQKDALEELTWMLSSGGQVAFVVIWARSRKIGSRLEDISFDASMGENRARMAQLEDVIYLKQKAIRKLVTEDSWDKALARIDTVIEGHGEQLEGLDLVRKTDAMMEIYAAMGRWDDAENNAVSILALRGGREAQIARLILVAASLSQRDFAEAKPRLAMLPDDDIEAARLQWFASIMQPKKRKLDEKLKSLLSVDPLSKRNVDLIKRYRDGIATTEMAYRNEPEDRLILLGDIARMRLCGKFEQALNILERYIKKNSLENWIHGNVVCALLHLDEGRILTATNIAENLAKTQSRHPHLRSLLRHLESIGQTISASSEPTGIEWLRDSGLDWVNAWPYRHTVAPAPALVTKELQKHAWKANGWISFGDEQMFEQAKNKLSNGWKLLSNKISESDFPPCLFTHITGVVVTIGGMPVDLGLPGDIDITTIEKAGLLD